MTEKDVRALSASWSNPGRKSSYLWSKLAGDVSAAVLSAALVAPSIAVIDR